MAKQPRALLTVALLAAASLSSLGAALPEPRSIVRASRKPSSNGDARLTTFPAIPRGGVTPADVKLAKKTYVFDGAMVAANLAFVYTWVFKSDKYFSPNFMKDGFCNSPDAVFHTQRNCGIFDWVVAALTFATIKKNGVKSLGPLGDGVLYPLVHGTAHFLISTHFIDVEKTVEGPLEIGILAFILAMGPVGAVWQLAKGKGWNDMALMAAVALGLDALVTWFFVSHIKKGVFVLLYINVVINLMLFLTRVLFFNPFKEGAEGAAAVKFRLSSTGPHVTASLASIAFMVFVMWVEPTMCDSLVAKIGGHIWFDVALFVMAWVVLQNAIANDS